MKKLIDNMLAMFVIAPTMLIFNLNVEVIYINFAGVAYLLLLNEMWKKRNNRQWCNKRK